MTSCRDAALYGAILIMWQCCKLIKQLKSVFCKEKKHSSCCVPKGNSTGSQTGQHFFSNKISLTDFYWVLSQRRIPTSKLRPPSKQFAIDCSQRVLCHVHRCDYETSVNQPQADLPGITWGQGAELKPIFLQGVSKPKRTSAQPRNQANRFVEAQHCVTRVRHNNDKFTSAWQNPAVAHTREIYGRGRHLAGKDRQCVEQLQQDYVGAQ